MRRRSGAAVTDGVGAGGGASRRPPVVVRPLSTSPTLIDKHAARDTTASSGHVTSSSGSRDVDSITQVPSPYVVDGRTPVIFGQFGETARCRDAQHGDYISAPRGCCALKFIHALEIAQALIAHTRSGTGVPPKNFHRENLKFGLKFSVLATITSGLVGVSPQNIFHTTCHEAGLITLV